MNQKQRVLLVDDEPLSNEALKLILNEFEHIEIVGECINGFEAINLIRNLNPDIVFLDIQMPKLSGFDVVELLGNETPLIVFVTAYDEYALKAFEVHAVDYLLKPVSKERLAGTLKQVEKHLLTNHKQPISELMQERQEVYKPISRVLVREGAKINIISTKEIIFIEAQDDYVSIVTPKTSHLKNERLSNLESLLDETNFCRIHRSYLINIEYLDKIEPSSKDSKMAILKNGKSLPISRNGYKKLIRFL